MNLRDEAIKEIEHDLHSTPWWKLRGLLRRRKLRAQLRRLRKQAV